jgi:hypothetical protein
MRKVVMVHSVVGEDNENGTSARKYMVGESLPLSKAWQKAIAQNMIDRGAAMEIQGNASPTETKRARDADGKLMADDPSTPNVNEAWEGGKAPTKKRNKSSKKPD